MQRSIGTPNILIDDQNVKDGNLQADMEFYIRPTEIR